METNFWGDKNFFSQWLGPYLSKKSLSTTAEMSSSGFPIPKSELGLKHKE